jgi:hypothetical protein
MDFLNEGFSFIQNSHLILFRTKKQVHDKFS